MQSDKHCRDTDMGARIPVDRRRASITMYDPARDMYTVSDDSPQIANAAKHINAHELAQEEETNDGALHYQGSTAVHNNEAESSKVCPCLFSGF